MKKRYFCVICEVSFRDPKSFIEDRQKHISNGELEKDSARPKTTIK